MRLYYMIRKKINYIMHRELMPEVAQVCQEWTKDRIESGQEVGATPMDLVCNRRSLARFKKNIPIIVLRHLQKFEANADQRELRWMNFTKLYRVEERKEMVEILNMCQKSATILPVEFLYSYEHNLRRQKDIRDLVAIGNETFWNRVSI